MWLTSQEDTDNNTKDAGDDYDEEVSHTAPEEGHNEEDQSVSVEDRVTNRGVVTEKESVTEDQYVTEDQSVTEEGSVADKEDDCRGWDTNEGSYSPRKAEVLYMRRFSNQPNRENRSQGPHRSWSFPPSPFNLQQHISPLHPPFLCPLSYPLILPPTLILPPPPILPSLPIIPPPPIRPSPPAIHLPPPTPSPPPTLPLPSLV